MRLVSLLTALAVTATGCVTPLVICSGNDPCAQQQQDNQHTEILVGMAVVGLVAATIAIVHASHSGPDKTVAASQVEEPPPPPAPPSRPGVGEATDETKLRVERLEAQARISAAAGRCDSVNAAVRELWTFAPAVNYQGFVAEPSIAACMQ